MSELRYDPVKKRWSVIAVERSRRPHDFLVDKSGGLHEQSGSACPLCPGNEDRTPEEIFSIRNSKNPEQWDLRVVPNKYPALRVEGELERKGHGLYDSVSGIGAHEIIIETPQHDLSLNDYPHEVLYNLFYTFRQRIEDLSKDSRFRYILPFKNYGALAGASLKHPHSQVTAIPVTPDVVKTKLNSAREHFSKKERCLFCDVLNQEHEDGERIVYENQDFIAFCPYASAVPFELQIFPKKHMHNYADIDEAGLHSLTEMMRDVFCRLFTTLENPPLNFLIHSCPPLHERPGKPNVWQSIQYDYHWHIEIIPRMTNQAGFEWGTGFNINPVKPEEAARYLREAALK